jgi:hypothetical protein
MEHSHITRLAAVLAAALVLAGAVAPAVLAQEGGTSTAPDAAYSILWFTIDGGGGMSSGGIYGLHGTAGQADAGVLTGGGYTLTGGYWTTQAARGVWLPLVIK